MAFIYAKCVADLLLYPQVSLKHKYLLPIVLISLILILFIIFPAGVAEQEGSGGGLVTLLLNGGREKDVSQKKNQNR